MIKYNQEELKKACKDSFNWVVDNLNPHQQLIITLDGIKIISDELYMPSYKPNMKIEEEIRYENRKR